MADEKTFTLHFDKVTFRYNAINDLRVLPAHLERPVFESAPEAYRERTLYNADPTNPGLYFGRTGSWSRNRACTRSSSPTRLGTAMHPISAASWCA